MNALNEALVTVHARIITMAAVPNPSPDFSGPGGGHAARPAGACRRGRE